MSCGGGLRRGGRGYNEDPFLEWGLGGFAKRPEVHKLLILKRTRPLFVFKRRN